MRSLQTLVEILLSESVSDGECMINLSLAPSQDYPTIWDGQKVSGGHRLVWEFHHGAISSGVTIHHTCRNKRCLNIEHLQALTASDHSRLHKPRLTHCPRHGIPFHRQGSKGEGVCRLCVNQWTVKNRAKYPERHREAQQRFLAKETPEHREIRLAKKRAVEKLRRERLDL